MRILPFRGTRYGTANAGELAAAPYDQIDDAERDRLHRIDRHLTHLTRPVPGDGLDAPAHAAQLYRRWKADGTVQRDDAASLYACVIDLPGGGRRLGLVAMVGLEDPVSGVIRPHEKTVEKTVAERLELLEHLASDLEPILLLADDGGALEDLLAEDSSAGAPLVDHTDDFGNRHRLLRVEPARNDRYVEALAPAQGLIADGHHRYRTAGLFARRADAPPPAAGAKLAVVTSLTSPALTIDPIHRGLPELPDEVRSAAVRSSLPARATSGGELAREVAAAEADGEPVMGVCRPGKRPELWTLDSSAGPENLPAAASQLAVVLLHHAVLPAWDFLPENATDGTLSYRSDPDVLWDEVCDGGFGLGVWLPPMAASTFHGAVAEGDLLPPKSTRFLPKVVSGLVWCDHDAPVV